MRTTVCNLCENELERENGRAQKYEPELPGGTFSIHNSDGKKWFQVSVKDKFAPDTDLCEECFRAVIASFAHALARQAAGESPECLKNPDLIGISRFFDAATLNARERRFAEMYGGSPLFSHIMFPNSFADLERRVLENSPSFAGIKIGKG